MGQKRPYPVSETHHVPFRSEGKLTLGEAHALAVLPEFMGDDGAMFPSHEAMAEQSGASRRTVINALNRAYALGIVKHTPRYQYDRQLRKRVRTSNAYEIVLSALQQVAQAARHFMRTVRDHLSARPHSDLSANACPDALTGGLRRSRSALAQT